MYGHLGSQMVGGAHPTWIALRSGFLGRPSCRVGIAHQL